jgi:hypothetical protein
MFCVEIPEDEYQSLNLAPRSKGLHLSDIINDIERVMYPKEYERTQGMTNPVWAEIGFKWERVLDLENRFSAAWKDGLGKRPGEIVRDGIIMSPDGECVADGYIEEYKCTWKSAKKTPVDIWRWMVQTKAYCYGMGVNVVKFRVCYVNGYYDFNEGPVRKTFLIEFTDEELEGNWSMIVNHAKSRGWI